MARVRPWFTPVAGDGSLRYYSMVATDLVVDAAGYFEGAP
jgi:hypothetical protein